MHCHRSGHRLETGLFNIGAAGQYTLGAFGALYFAIVLGMPWWVCLLVSAAFGALWGAIPGIFKAYLNINEVITSIMFNWIGLYLVNEIIYGRGSGVMYDAHNTRTWKLATNAPQALIPSCGMSELFHTSNTTIAIFLAIIVAIVVWVVLEKTTFGYELKAVGLNKNAARYAGINEKKNVILSMTIAPPACLLWALTALQPHGWQTRTPSAPSSLRCSSVISALAAHICPPSISPAKLPT